MTRSQTEALCCWGSATGVQALHWRRGRWLNAHKLSAHAVAAPTFVKLCKPPVMAAFANQIFKVCQLWSLPLLLAADIDERMRWLGNEHSREAKLADRCAVRLAAVAEVIGSGAE